MAAKTVNVNLEQLVRAVRSSDGAPRLAAKQLDPAARLTVHTLALATLGRRLHLNLGNGFQLECRVAAVPETNPQPITAGATA